MSENEIAILMGMFLEAKPEITEAQLKKMVLDLTLDPLY